MSLSWGTRRFTEVPLQPILLVMPDRPGRPPRLPTVFQKYDPPVYFVTICAAGRRRLIANDIVHNAFREFATKAHRERSIAVGRYVLMPDHIHLFVCGPAEFNLSQWVRMLKLALGRKLAELGKQPGFWQRGFFDHLIRHSESYAEKWAYVWQNPVRAGLVAQVEDWPYQGEIVVIDRV